MPARFERLRKRPRHYQAWFPSDATWGLHYEILDRDGQSPSLEIHIEEKSYREHAQPLLKEWSTSLADKFPTATVTFDPNWCRHRGRLQLNYAPSATVSELADDFEKLVSLTKGHLWPSSFAPEVDGS